MNWSQLENQILESLIIEKIAKGGSAILSAKRELYIDSMVRKACTEDEELDLLDNSKIDDLLARKWSFSDIALFQWNPDSDIPALNCYWRALDMGCGCGLVWKKSWWQGSTIIAAWQKNDPNLFFDILYQCLLDNGLSYNIQLFDCVPHRITNYYPSLLPEDKFKEGIEGWLKWSENYFGSISLFCPYTHLKQTCKDPEIVMQYPELKNLGELIVMESKWCINGEETDRKWKEYGLDKIRQLYLNINFSEMYREQVPIT